VDKKDDKWTGIGLSKGSNREVHSEPSPACIWFYKEKWYARQDSNLRPLAPEANSYHVLSTT